MSLYSPEEVHARRQRSERPPRRESDDGAPVVSLWSECLFRSGMGKSEIPLVEANHGRHFGLQRLGDDHMPRTRSAYPPESRNQMVELVRSGTAEALSRNSSPLLETIRNWLRQTD